MASFKDSISRGITTLNVKTSNFMEENKLKTAISTKEQEISQLKVKIADIVYDKRKDFSIDAIENELTEIEKKYEEIEELKKQIGELAEAEKNILGASDANQGSVATNDSSKVFCTECGTANPENYKFCTKCGSKLTSE